MLQGLDKELSRLGIGRQGWIGKGEREVEQPEREIRLSFSYCSNVGSDVEADRKGMVDTIFQAVQNGLLEVGKAQRMLNTLEAQWRQSARAKEATAGKSKADLVAMLAAARAENARLRGE
jgi:hypothetical protein